eukprot:scaffold6511_cov170-Skeletonema_marinoi.AAC.1
MRPHCNSHAKEDASSSWQTCVAGWISSKCRECQRSRRIMYGRPELALHLECDDTVLIERILSRGKKSSSDGGPARADDNIDTALQRIRTYHKYHKLTCDFLREEHVPIVNLDCSASPDG